jgi:molybdopterin-guanine dinucleotide biosynthesis protein MobB
MRNALIPVLCFVAFSGTGKTTLLTQIIPELKKHGLRIALIKHSHHDFEVDQPGKDSFRLRAAGASPVLLVSPYRRVIITEFSELNEPDLDDQLASIDQTKIDIVLVEGFKHSRYSKIELHRQSLNKPLLYPNDPSIIAVASDSSPNLPVHLKALDINNKADCINFILQFIQSYQSSQTIY